MIWYDMIWYDMISMIWYDKPVFDMIWYNAIMSLSYHFTMPYDKAWRSLIRFNMINYYGVTLETYRHGDGKRYDQWLSPL